MLRAFAALAGERSDVHLVLAGDASAYAALASDIAAHAIGGRVHVTGYIADDEIPGYLAAADVCLCLRWPTALETSGSWLQCLSAGRPTLISDLAHLVDIPTIDPRGWTANASGAPPIAIAIDLLNEDEALLMAMRRLAADRHLRDELGRAGHAYWAGNHTLDIMTDDYRRAIARASTSPAPVPGRLPEHFTDDHSAFARSLVRRFGVDMDILGPEPR
jgi:glycosyltransferase involved in cell wall biosynthesis